MHKKISIKYINMTIELRVNNDIIKTEQPIEQIISGRDKCHFKIKMRKQIETYYPAVN